MLAADESLGGALTIERCSHPYRYIYKLSRKDALWCIRLSYRAGPIVMDVVPKNPGSPRFPRHSNGTSTRLPPKSQANPTSLPLGYLSISLPFSASRVSGVPLSQVKMASKKALDWGKITDQIFAAVVVGA